MHLGAGQVGPDRVVDAGPERQRSRSRPVGRDVERVRLDRLAIGVPGGDEDNRRARLTTR